MKVFWKGVRVNGMGNVKIENFVARGGDTANGKPASKPTDMEIINGITGLNFI